MAPLYYGPRKRLRLPAGSTWPQARLIDSVVVVVQMDVMLSESSNLIDGYLTSQVIQFDSSTSGLKVTFAVYMEFNSTTLPHEIEEIVQNFLNRSIIPLLLRLLSIFV